MLTYDFNNDIIESRQDNKQHLIRKQKKFQKNVDKKLG